jgi:hypothetical protein
MEITTQTSRRVNTVYNVMKLTYGIVPIVAGLDKFTNLLTNWEQYLNPAIVQILPFTPHIFMMIVGVVEIIAGLIVLSKPAIGGYVVMAWLASIGLSLLAGKDYLDVAVRDFVMAIGAYSLAQIARAIAPSKAQYSPGEKIAFS